VAVNRLRKAGSSKFFVTNLMIPIEDGQDCDAKSATSATAINLPEEAGQYR